MTMEMDTMVNHTGAEHELHSLRERLADAWWNEAPLRTILELEHEIEQRKGELNRDKDHGRH
jgi:hypothetical protein